MASSISPAFTRTRTVRIASGVASAGVLAGFSLVGAVPAMAATDADCTVLNTVSATSGDTEADLQLALDDATLPIVCVDGTFVLATGLNFNRDLTLHGLTGATLDGNNLVPILNDTSDINSITIENLHLTRGYNGVSNGGAINAGYVTAINSVFDQNYADFRGGAIYAYGVTLTNSQVVGNEAYEGGGVWASDSVAATNSSFSSNFSNNVGGAIASYGTLDVTASTFDENEGYIGGAVFADDETNVTNSTFFRNTAGFGAGIFAPFGTILQNTFFDNTSDTGDGQAILLAEFFSAATGELQLRANLFASTSTTKPQLENISTGGFFNDLGGNLFSTAVATETGFTPGATTKFTVAPAALFATGLLANNGGPTNTVALKVGSAAIDAVMPGTPFVLTDQRGVTRTSLSDAGSFEFGNAAVAPALAATGVETTGWLTVAAAMLLAGAALALVRTRRLLRRG